MKTKSNTLNSNASTAITTDQQTDGLSTPRHLSSSLAPNFESGEVTMARPKRIEIKSVERNLKKEVDEEVKCTL